MIGWLIIIGALYHAASTCVWILMYDRLEKKIERLDESTLKLRRRQ